MIHSTVSQRILLPRHQISEGKPKLLEGKPERESAKTDCTISIAEAVDSFDEIVRNITSIVDMYGEPSDSGTDEGSLEHAIEVSHTLMMRRLGRYLILTILSCRRSKQIICH